MNINMSQFKKVKEDDKSATLKHADGHHITIAKKALSPKMQKELSSIPMHLAAGSEEPVQDPNVRHGATGSWDDAPKEAPQTAPQAAPEAQPAPLAPVNPPPVINVNVGQQPVGPMTPPSGAVQNVIQDPNAKEGAKEEAMKAASMAPATQFPEPKPLAPAAQVPPTPQDAMTPQAPQQPIAQMDPFQAAPQGIQMQAQGIAGEAQAMGEAGRQQADIYAHAAQAQQNLMDQFNAVTQPMMKERAALQQDMANQHFDSKRYVKNMSVGNKIMAGIGMILGGMGQGLIGGDNPSESYLNKMIERDIEDQRKDFGKKQTLLEANYKNFGDLKAATEMTRVQLGDVFSNLIQQQAAQTQDPLAKSRAAQAVGQLYQNGSAVIKNNGFEQMLYNRMNGGQQPGQGQAPQDNQAAYMDYLRFKNPEMAKSLEDRYVPGIGTASVPVPQDVRAKLVAGEHLNHMLHDIQDFAEKNQGTVFDRETVRQGKVKAALLQDAYRQAAAAGVFKESEFQFINSIIDEDPTKFLADIRTQPGYKELENSNTDRLDLLKKSVGLQVPFRPKSRKEYSGK